MSDSLDLVDPELCPLLDMWGALTIDAAVLADIRTNGRALTTPPVVANGVVRTEHRVPGPAAIPDILLTVYTRQARVRSRVSITSTAAAM
jgi:triacylglycerol lipase